MVDHQTTTNHDHAVSAYSPNRRNSFLQDPIAVFHHHPSSTITSKLSTMTLGLTLIIIRFWKDARIWKELVLRMLPILPQKWRLIVTAYLQKWQGSTTNVVKRLVSRLLRTLQEQLSPFLQVKAAVPTLPTAAAASSSISYTDPPPQTTTASPTLDAPTCTILCDGESSSAMTDTPLAFSSTTTSSSSYFTYYEDRVRQNQSLIHKVLQYWFGQYEPDQAQKKLWMIANSSVDWRRKVDAEIADLFTPLLLELASASAAAEGSSSPKSGATVVGTTKKEVEGEEETTTAADNTTTTTSTTTSSGGSTLQPPNETTTASKQAAKQQQQQQQPCRWQQWCIDKDLYGYQGKLAAIIVLDQFSRHIRRHQQEEANQLAAANNNHNNTLLHDQELPSQEELDSLAYQTAQALVEDHNQEIQCGMIPIPQYIFGLMPYRHANTLNNVQYVQNCVSQVAAFNVQFDAMTSRFRKATNRRMAVLQDEARRTGKSTTSTTETKPSVEGDENENENENIVGKDRKQQQQQQQQQEAISATPEEEEQEQEQEQAKSVQQQQQSDASTNPSSSATTTTTTLSFSDEDILETFPFEADMSDAMDHPVVKTIRSFLTEQGIHPVGGGEGETRSTNKKMKNKKMKNKSNSNSATDPKQQQRQQQSPTSQSPTVDSSSSNAAVPSTPLPPTCSVIISLSGGVDSMVIASVLAFLKQSNESYFPHLNVVAIHIDYANRPESKAESDYVQRYCQQKGIRFVVRRIEEVTRGITARDEYEQRARQMRYDMYRSVAHQCITEQQKEQQSQRGQQQQQQQQQCVVGVMLGHHRGDLRENVLSNAHKGCGPLDLSGMTAVSQNDGVTIFRPLLPLEKTEVYDYAHRYGVPYFKDTTPHWSTRGKLRNKLLPLLEEIYGEGSMNNLSTLATESDECRDLLNKALLQPFMDQVVRSPMGIMFETAPFRFQGFFFWKFVLRRVLHSAGLGMFSDKSVLSFLERISPVHTYKKTIRQGWLQCRRDYAVYLQEDGKIFVFYPDSLPWLKSGGFTCEGDVFDLTQQSTIAVGPWIIEAEKCDVGAEERSEKLKKKAVTSMTDFMQGFIEYYLQVPTIQRDQMENEETSYVPSPLVFAPAFRRETRPQAWKNTDEKLQEILPLLGLTIESTQELKCPTSENPVAIVRVTLDRRFSSD